MRVVIINNAEDNKFAYDFASGFGQRKCQNCFKKFWIGGRKNSDSGRWEWSDGQALNYTSWNKWEPDQDDDCVTQSGLSFNRERETWNKDPIWSGEPCDGRHNIVCEEA